MAVDRTVRPEAPTPRPVRVVPVQPDISPEQAARNIAKAQEILRTALRSFGDEGDTDGALTRHVDRLMGRGLEESAAWRQARAMVEDPHHRANCPICQGDDDVPF